MVVVPLYRVKQTGPTGIPGLHNTGFVTRMYAGNLRFSVQQALDLGVSLYRVKHTCSAGIACLHTAHQYCVCACKTVAFTVQDALVVIMLLHRIQLASPQDFSPWVYMQTSECNLRMCLCSYFCCAGSE